MLLSELTAAIERGDVLEMFGTGTAANVLPIAKFGFEGKEYGWRLRLGYNDDGLQ